MSHSDDGTETFLGAHRRDPAGEVLDHARVDLELASGEGGEVGALPVLHGRWIALGGDNSTRRRSWRLGCSAWMRCHRRNASPKADTCRPKLTHIVHPRSSVSVR